MGLSWLTDAGLAEKEAFLQQAHRTRWFRACPRQEAIRTAFGQAEEAPSSPLSFLGEENETPYSVLDDDTIQDFAMNL